MNNERLEMNVVCRTCLSSIECGAQYYDLKMKSSDSNTSGAPLIRPKLESLVPELTLDIIKDAVMCNECLETLCAAYKFKKRCLETEEKIYDYILHADGTLDSIDINLVIKWAGGPIKSPVPPKKKNEELPPPPPPSQNKTYRCSGPIETFEAEEVTRLLAMRQRPPPPLASNQNNSGTVTVSSVASTSTVLMSSVLPTVVPSVAHDSRIASVPICSSSPALTTVPPLVFFNGVKHHTISEPTTKVLIVNGPLNQIKSATPCTSKCSTAIVLTKPGDNTSPSMFLPPGYNYKILNVPKSTTVPSVVPWPQFTNAIVGCNNDITTAIYSRPLIAPKPAGNDPSTSAGSALKMREKTDGTDWKQLQNKRRTERMETRAYSRLMNQVTVETVNEEKETRTDIVDDVDPVQIKMEVTSDNDDNDEHDGEGGSRSSLKMECNASEENVVWYNVGRSVFVEYTNGDLIGIMKQETLPVTAAAEEEQEEAEPKPEPEPTRTTGGEGYTLKQFSDFEQRCQQILMDCRVALTPLTEAEIDRWKRNYDSEESPQAMYWCPRCVYASPIPADLKHHMRIVHKCNFLRCTDCTFVCVRKHELSMHYLTHFYENASKHRHHYACKLCDYSVETAIDIKEHVQAVHDLDGVTYWCLHCSYNTSVRSRYNKHRLNKHQKKKKRRRQQRKSRWSASESSGDSSRDECELSRALPFTMLRSDVNYVCMECEYRTQSRHALYRHYLRAHFKNEPFKCCCSKDVFCNRHLFIEHLLVHSEASRNVNKEHDYTRLRLKC